MSMGPDALRAPGRTAAGRPGRRRRPARRAAGAQGRGRAPARPSGRRPATASSSSSLYEALRLVLDRTRRPSHPRRPARLLRLRLQRRHLARLLRVDPDEYFDDPATRLAPDAESMIVLANPVQPHSEGEIVLASADPAVHPDIRMNYYDDPHDMTVMIAAAPQGARHRRELAAATARSAHCSSPRRSPPSTATPPATRRATSCSRTSRATTR